MYTLLVAYIDPLSLKEKIDVISKFKVPDEIKNITDDAKIDTQLQLLK